MSSAVIYYDFFDVDAKSGLPNIFNMEEFIKSPVGYKKILLFKLSGNNTPKDKAEDVISIIRPLGFEFFDVLWYEKGCWYAGVY